jgi:response regulator RpfG family c-di-GMP phosphodiesterase
MTESTDVPVSPRGSLLLVDDEANVLASLRRLFRPLGYTIHTAVCGADGLAILAQEPIDLVISDMRMPQMTGAEFLAQVAQRWPGVTRILLTGYADLAATVDAINRGHIYGYFSKPWEDNDIRLTVQHAFEQKRLREERDRLLDMTRRQNDELKALNLGLEQQVLERTEEVRQAHASLQRAYQQLQESYYATIPVFASLVQLREGPGAGHGMRVAELARDMAGYLSLDEDDVRHTYFAGLLHDTGKLAWSDHLLHTPHARLNTVQRKEVERHPIIGQAILMALEPLQKTAQLIRHHHENFDGTGYPDRLSGARIPLGARILAVANDYDGLLNGTLLGDVMPVADAHAYIQARRGTRYDAAVVDALFEVLDAKDEGEGLVRELRLEVGQLVPGMVLSRDLLSSEGVLLLTRGYCLNESMVRKLTVFVQENMNHLVVHVLPGESLSVADEPA